MERKEFLYSKFRSRFSFEPTSCQESLLQEVADFVTCDDADILVVNGYAGTGKTTAVAAVVAGLRDVGVKTVLLAPTGRSAKVLSRIASRPAFTIHKHIYRQKSVGENGLGAFSLSPNKARNTLFVVDEVSLISTLGSEGEEKQNTLFGTGNLLFDLVDFVRAGDDCRLMLIGDSAQLPPVGMDTSPCLDRDYMKSAFSGVKFSTLSTVVRQEKESGILRCASSLRGHILSCESLPLDSLELDLDGTDDVERISGGELIEALNDAYSRYGEDETIVLCRSNKRAIRYNMGIRSTVQYKEEKLVKGEKLMIVKNCYQFLENVPRIDYIANGDIANLEKIGSYEERYGLHFATATLSFPDYDGVSIDAKVCLDTLESESASLSYEQQNALYQGVSADYADRGSRRRVWMAVREDKYFNALQLKYAQAITCHKSQGGQWDCVFVDYPFWQDELSREDLRWLYTAFTRAVKKLYLVNFKDSMFV